MLAASLGMKLFDVTRRILMYTKDSDMYKRTYAICRGSFPIHELCGTITALLLARRDVLGVNLPQWQIIGPAVLIHGMANFRGMKVSCCRYLPSIVTLSRILRYSVANFWRSIFKTYIKGFEQISVLYSLLMVSRFKAHSILTTLVVHRPKKHVQHRLVLYCI